VAGKGRHNTKTFLPNGGSSTVDSYQLLIVYKRFSHGCFQRLEECGLHHDAVGSLQVLPTSTG